MTKLYSRLENSDASLIHFQEIILPENSNAY